MATLRNKNNHRLLIIVLLSLISAHLSGCAATRNIWPPYNIQILSATEKVNPNLEGRSSPIQIKILQLSERTTFDNLSFDQLFYQSQTLLGDTLISEQTVILQPGEQIKHRVMLESQVSHIAIVAAYRAIDRSQWQFVYPVKPNSHRKNHFKLNETGISPVNYIFSKDFKKQTLR